MKDFNTIYKEVHPKLLGYLITLTKDIALAEDIASQTMYKVYENMDKLDERIGKASTYAIHIGRNLLIDHHRKRRVETRSVDDYTHDNGESKLQVTSGHTPSDVVINTELGETIRECVEALPPQYRNLAHLYFYEQMTYKEIQEELGVPLGTVKGTIARLRNKLQDLVGEAIAA